MSTQQNIEIVTNCFVAVGRGDKQVLPVLSAEHTKWTSNPWMGGSNVSSLLKRTQVAYLRYRASRLQQEQLRASDGSHMRLSKERQ